MKGTTGPTPSVLPMVKTVRFRGSWEPLADGRVRQYFEQSADDGGTWQPWFEGFYSRRTGTQ